MAIGAVALYRGVTARLVVLLAFMTACGRNQDPAPGSAPAPASRPARETPFVANIRSVRGDVIVVMEEGGKQRLGEIFVTPGTEITTRDGAMFVPAANLRANMRVTVWFLNGVRENPGTLLGTARRMLVDY
jgi:hypothetical protein